MKFEPSQREKTMVFGHLPATKEYLISIIKRETGLSEKYARSLIWNMRHCALLYTGDNHLIKKGVKT